MKKVYQWLLMGSLMVLTFCLGITTYAESKTSQAGITFTGDGSIEVSVILQKKDKETKEVLSDATFELRDEKGSVVEVAQSMTTDEKGEIHLTRLFPGKYTFVETKSPKGYRLDKTPIPFEVGFDQISVKVTAYNEKSKKTGGITPTESTNKNESTSNKKPVTQKQEVAKKAKGNLPKTGVKMSSVWMIIGILILVSAIYGMYRKYITK
ncbi:LPXTG cell wall anchor domain-containing protein [Enterococcus faecalis]|uniref:LPXTG cell wall anchor domain-containing protein n=1 Tax=Enterococcus faecalis TaxID=1351 RepID=UPI00026D6685|nr:LPXTG cell wall anchor domain-containing protein [Enterococcus faecalis]AFO44725.1 Cna protein B-type domain, cell envelope biogenesis, outer membrane protein [Enterococcus faecalis D32]EGO5030528.1 LPXTG cell wall anchor domain-containing protein [Enterococcus faecalis]EGO5085628.1 LPXTG cell wall anchor domain-containing protein [Enterococcus faecalis]EGO5094323.1 LPXTG cell wall anchor domain-containing protein [Enterococcus faecalis]EGO5157997.1 LPXTG cell wall anchor domain-containing 